MRARLTACAAVAVSALAFALYTRVEWRWFALGWIGFVPWLAALDRRRSFSGALALGWLMSVAFVLAVFSWFALAMRTYTGASTLAAFAALVLIAPLLEPQLVVFAVARHVLRLRTPFAYATFAAALAYVGTEWFWPKLFGDTIGHGFLVAPRMRQAADLFGAHGFTFVLVIANECVHASIARVRSGEARHALFPAACAGAIALVLVAYGTLRLRQLDDVQGTATPITAALVQADIAQYDRLRAERGTFEAVREILDTHMELSARALERGGVDVLVWPETVYPTTFGRPKSDDGAMFDRSIAGFATEMNVPIVFGSYDSDESGEFNAAMFLEPATDGRIAYDTYRKARLFLLTERLPAVLESETVRRWLPWLGTWKPGAGPQTMELRLRDGRTVRVAPLICLDAVDPGLALEEARRGAEVIVTLSNDSWFAEGNGPNLHLTVSAFRSLETRRPQLRATNTGISAVITSTGEIVASAGVHERRALIGTVTPSHAHTLMIAWGDWFGRAAYVAAILLIAAAFMRR
jgi:apolipoprotein N-acyltransferase